jgi:ABC-type multidrug transport system ATPase subunit
VDGHKMSRSVFVEQAIYVPREDNLWPTMNPRQHLEFAFKNFRPELDADRLKAEVDELLSVTGLTSCQTPGPVASSSRGSPAASAGASHSPSRSSSARA